MEPYNNIKRICGCYFECGEHEPACMDFHHLDHKTKLFAVNSVTILRKPTDRLIEELKKCECVCANCHRKLHAGLLEKPAKIRPLLHKLLLEVVRPDPRTTRLVV